MESNYCVYRFLNKNNEIIYIGRTSTGINSRIKDHRASGHLPQDCYNSIRKIEYCSVPTLTESMIIEQYLINKEKPIYNDQFKEKEDLILKIDLSY